jgi:rhodanese-related sulfurtransferase
VGDHGNLVGSARAACGYGVSMIEVDAADAAELIDSGALLLDVREPEEWEAGHVPGASFVPLGSLPLRLGELPTDRRIVVMCRVGGRSAVATEALVLAGLDAVNLAGGIVAWAAEERPVVTSDGCPGTVI